MEGREGEKGEGKGGRKFMVVREDGGEREGGGGREVCRGEEVSRLRQEHSLPYLLCTV